MRREDGQTADLQCVETFHGLCGHHSPILPASTLISYLTDLVAPVEFFRRVGCVHDGPGAFLGYSYTSLLLPMEDLNELFFCDVAELVHTFEEGDLTRFVSGVV